MESPLTDAAEAPPPSPQESTANRERALRWRLLGLCTLAGLCVVFPKLSFPAGFLTLVAFVATPRNVPYSLRVLLFAAVIGSAIGLLRFVLEDAIPGVVAGGKSAIEKQAVSYLRTIVTAQDQARTNALVDADGDRIGSALFLEELGGLKAPPGGSPLSPALLRLDDQQLAATSMGTAVRHAGYLFRICLPGPASSWVSSSPDDGEQAPQRDFESAERRYMLYAWPEALSPGSPTAAYFADQHERILMLPSSDRPRYVGTTHPPACDAALQEKDWQTWKDKAPRKALPGDSAPLTPSSTP